MPIHELDRFLVLRSEGGRIEQPINLSTLRTSLYFYLRDKLTMGIPGMMNVRHRDNEPITFDCLVV